MPPIIIAGTIQLDPERRDAAVAAAEPYIAGARSQPGCLEYSFCADSTRPGTIVVLERWADAEALRAHFAGPHYRAMRDHLGNSGLLGADVAKHRVDLSEPVYDPTGVPRPDFFSAPGAAPAPA